MYRELVLLRTYWVLCALMALATALTVSACGSDDDDDDDDDDIVVPAGALEVTANTVWDSDTTLDNTVIVRAGATLEVAAGVVVEFMPGTAIYVDGAIAFAGDSERPGPTMRAALSIPAGVGALHIGGSGDASNLDYGTFEGVDVRLYGAAMAGMTGAKFVGANLQVESRAEGFAMSDCSFTQLTGDFTVALEMRDVAKLEMSGCEFRDVYRAIDVGGYSGETAMMVDIQNTEFANIVGSAVALDRTDAVLSGVSFADIGDNAITADLDSSTEVSMGTFSNVGGTCIAALGGGAVRDSNLMGCGAEGIRSLHSMEVRDTDIANSRYGVFAEWDTYNFAAAPIIDLVDVDISNSRQRGIFVIGRDSTTKLARVTLDGAASNECALIQGRAEIADASATGCALEGFEIGRGGTVVNLLVNDVGGAGLEFDDAEGKDVTIDNYDGRNLGGHGLMVGAVRNVDIEGVTIETAGKDCALIGGASKVVADVLVNGCGRDGLLMEEGGGEIKGVTVMDSAGYGVRFIGDVAYDAIAREVVVQNSGDRGVFFAISTEAESASVVASNITVENAGAEGIFSALANTSIDGASVTDSAGNGIELAQSHGNAIANATVMGAGGDGIAVANADIRDCHVEGAAENGVNAFRGAVAGSIRNCDIIDNGYNGVQCREALDENVTMFDVVGNNITGNGGRTNQFGSAVDHCRLVEGNYIYNNGVLDNVVETTANVGTLDDGTRNSDGVKVDGKSQIEDADRIVSSSNTPIAGTGPQASEQ